eukprot:271608_1
MASNNKPNKLLSKHKQKDRPIRKGLPAKKPKKGNPKKIHASSTLTKKRYIAASNNINDLNSSSSNANNSNTKTHSISTASIKWQTSENTTNGNISKINLLISGYLRNIYKQKQFDYDHIIKLICSYNSQRLGIYFLYQERMGNIAQVIDQMKDENSIYLSRERMIIQTKQNKLLITGDIFGDRGVCGPKPTTQWLQFEKLAGNDRHNELIEIVSDGNVGAGHVLILCKSGNMYCFGKNGYGQCGNGQTRNPDSPDRNPKVYQWQKTAKQYFDGNVIKMCCGQFSLFLIDNGKLYSCGCNLDGRAGVDSRHNIIGVYRNGGKNCVVYPTLIERLQMYKIVDVSMGNSHAICLTNEGKMLAWGINHCGQCCMGNTETWIRSPTLCQLLKDYRIVKVDCSEYHNVVIDENGKAFLFGLNSSGQVGNGQCDQTSSWDLIVLEPFLFQSALNGCLEKVKVMKAVAGYQQTLILTGDNKIYYMGSGLNGLLYQCNPILVDFVDGNVKTNVHIVNMIAWKFNMVIVVEH